MIDFYTWKTPNGEKPMIMLEECGLEYRLHMIDISAGEQKTPDYLAINPNGKIPAIVDHDGDEPVTVFESGAILLHLADKTGRFLPAKGAARGQALSWTFFQSGGTGPMIGQWFHFSTGAPDKLPYAIERFRNEAFRLLGVLDQRLSGRDFLAGDYSIADIMNVGWIRAGLPKLKEAGAGELPALTAWLERVDARPAVARALEKLERAKQDKAAQ
ncbi:glutathione S-transferase N-terminal domain-containing protein [Jiella sp. MQZ9-1]|uniref:Glutathione S-transferase N-terminal domain-containing protein n=1 Tax=Jiella flava TaxID=2816857 RepID=A0A939FYS0_9HYPH|nr:glutathione S-transferase N-terminal domain-containing protein [Jiella flava]MBO0664493.1 glutathione S-transferase N-terminal domain-containing protein [Jiella flava]MCD2473129.1 glutathione S-transferase N-terminal domain-containing protein [Jiella flava]